jgi:hypothetical protein
MTISRIAVTGLILSLSVGLQGCIAMAAGAVVGTAVGVTGAVATGTVKGVGAVGRAVIPGDSRDDDER